MSGNPNDGLETRPLCLIAEDETMLATVLEIEFAEAGLEVAGPFKSVASAVSWLEFNRPTVAIVDTSLQDGSSQPLVDALIAAGVPFLVHSGAPPSPEKLKVDLSKIIWLIKPVLPSIILKEVMKIQNIY